MRATLDCGAWSTIYVVRPTSAKFDLHASDMKLSTQNELRIIVRIIMRINLLGYLSMRFM